MRERFEKEYDEEFYDDDSQEENLSEENDVFVNSGDDEEISKEEVEEDWDGSGETKADLSFACEDCDYRWDDIIVGEKDDIEHEDFHIICPMCGSINITQI